METLALAYHFTGNEAYAAHAAKCLRVRFLDPATRMNPHLNFAQAVPGKNTGRAAGVLEGRNLVNAGTGGPIPQRPTACRMNPHLNFAQAIPGVSPGRGIGIIGSLHLIEIPVAVAALEKSQNFPAEIASGMRNWFADYLDWMITSDLYP